MPLAAYYLDLRSMARVTQAEWDRRAAKQGLRWLDEVKGAHVKAPAACLTCGLEWEVLPSNVSKGSGCPECALAALGKERRLSQSEWDTRAARQGLRWVAEVRGADTKVRAECLTCGHEWEARPTNVTRGHGCPACAGVAPVTNTEWDRRAEAQGLRWLDEVKNTRTKTRAACLTCGHEWEALPESITGGSGCPKCADRLPVTQEEWDRRAEAQGLTWLDEVKHSERNTRVACLTCGHEWEARPANVGQGSSCPACAQYGFDPDRPTLLYFVERPEGIGKVGITNGAEVTETKRLAKWADQGYSLVKAWSSEDGHKIAALERTVLSWWRNDLGLPPALTEGDGFTETVALSEVSVPEIVEFVEQEIRALGIEAVPIVEVED